MHPLTQALGDGRTIQSPHSDGVPTDGIDLIVVSWYRELLGRLSRALEEWTCIEAQRTCIQDTSDGSPPSSQDPEQGARQRSSLHDMRWHVGPNNHMM
jgi:hypothetical protein